MFDEFDNLDANEKAVTNTEPRLLANRLQRLVFQGQASLIGRWASLARAKRWCPRGITCVASPVKPSHLQATSAGAAKANAPLQRSAFGASSQYEGGHKRGV